MNLTDRLTAAPQVIARTLGSETVILHLATGMYFGLDAVGARSWHLLEAGMSLGQVCETLVKEYDVTQAQVERDVLNFSQTLLDKQLVQFVR